MMKRLKQAKPVAIILSFAVLLSLLAGWQAKYRNRVFPGVSVAGIKAEGMDKNEVEKILQEKYKKMQTLKLVSGTNHWVIGAGDIDLKFYPDETAEAAINIGRKGNLKTRITEIFNALRNGKQVNAVYSFDEAKFNEAVSVIAQQINIPAQEPEVIPAMQGGNQISVSPGENGQEVNENLLGQRIRWHLSGADSQPIELPITLLRPKLTAKQTENARQRALRLLGKKIKLELEETSQNWEITDILMLTWMDLGGDGWLEQKISVWVEELALSIDRPAQNASFRFVESGKVEEFKPEKDGLRVMREEMINKIAETLKKSETVNEEQTLAVAIEKTKPDVSAGEINDLGIKEMIGRGESWFTGSITNRIYNLKRAADLLNGVLIAPGETFSFNKTVGEISAATGYKSAYIIKEGKTILGDGGGVCQVSTTLFRAVLASGLPIEERVAHAYRVSYYEVNYQVGYDATVFQPSPDFKFVNDTPGYVLIQTVYDEAKKYLAFELYGTSDGRKAEISKARVWEVTAPPPDLYIDDPTLPVGKVVQTEHKAWGSKVAFDWKVTKGEEVLQERTFYSNYRSWQAVYLRGTKVN